MYARAAGVSLFTNYYIVASGVVASRRRSTVEAIGIKEKGMRPVSAKKKLKDDRVVCVKPRVIITIIDADRLFRH